MSSLLTTTGIALLIGSGVVALPHPPTPSGGGVTPPPAPTEWYDVLFAKRNGAGAGAAAPVGGYTDGATFAAATSGVSDNGSQLTVSSNGVLIKDVDIATAPRSIQALTADNLTIDNVVTSVVAGKIAQIDLRDSNHTIRNVTIVNPSKIKGVPSILLGHLTSNTGTHLIENLYLPLACGDIKGANNGITQIRGVVMTGVIWGAVAHFDGIDWRGSLPGSFCEDSIFVADADPSSASGAGTGFNNFFRSADGNVPSGIRHSRNIIVGSNFPGNNSYMVGLTSGGSGIIIEDLLVDVRSEQQFWYPNTGGGIEDWHEVRSFSWAQALADGFITPGALIPFPELGLYPAAVPNQMAAPVITALAGGFSYGPMARPWNQRSQITGYTIQYSFDGIAWTSVAASLDGGTIATPAGANLRTRVYATNGVGNSAVSPVSNFVTVTAGVTQPLSINALPFDGFVFDAASTDSAVALITGKSDSLAAVQVRGEGAGGNTAWVATTADAAGNWTVFLSLDANAGEWYTPAARLGTNDATKVTSAAKFAGGDVHIFAGQSETEHILATASAYNQNPYPALLAQNLTMITQANTGSRVIRRIDTTGIGVVNVAMVALANLFHRAKPGRKLLIIDNAVSGESRGALHNDANTGMNWSDLQSTIDLIRGAGGEIGHWTECWYNADASSIKTFGLSWAPFYMGQRWGGGSFTLGTANPDDGAGPVDHCLWDIEAAADVYGRGAFMRTRTKLHLLTPMPFHDTGSASENVNFTTDSGGALITNRIRSLDRPARDTLDAFGADSRVQTFLGAVGPSCHVVDFAGGIHPLPGSQWGTPQYAMLHAPAVLRGAGYPIAEPTIDAANPVLGAAGAYVEIPVFLPNGGTLTTLRTLAGLSAPAVQPPHYQAVVGFEIRRAGDTDLQRRPVMKTTETSYPANYRGTVTISDSGTGSGAARKGIVRITPTNAFVTGDRFEYLRGQASAELIEMRDPNAQLFLDMLIEHIPGLYFPADTYPFYGVPVKPQPPLITV